MTTTGNAYDPPAHTELLERLKALEPDDRWVDVDPKLLRAAAPNGPERVLYLESHPGHPILDIAQDGFIEANFPREQFADEALGLLVQLLIEIGEEIFAGMEPNFGSGVPQKAFVNLRSVRICLSSTIQNGQRTMRTEASYAVLAQLPEKATAE